MNWIGLSTSVLVIAVLAGCTSAEPPSPTSTRSVSTPTQTPSAPPSPSAAGGTFATIDELRAAAQVAGIDCTSWAVKSGVAGATAAGTCGGDEGWGLALFPTKTERDHVLQLNQDSDESEVFLAGPNWLVNHYFGSASDLTGPQKSLGGTIWQRGDAFPA